MDYGTGIWRVETGEEGQWTLDTRLCLGVRLCSHSVRAWCLVPGAWFLQPGTFLLECSPRLAEEGQRAIETCIVVGHNLAKSRLFFPIEISGGTPF